MVSLPTTLTSFLFLALTASAAIVDPPNRNSSIYPPNPCTHRSIKSGTYGGQRNISYFVVDGFAVIDGDVIYGRVEDLDNPLPPNEALPDTKRALSILQGPNTWPNGVLTYRYKTPEIETLLKPIVDAAIQRWLSGAPWLQFVQLPNSDIPQNGIAIFDAPVCGGCNAHIGYDANAPRNMNLQQSCPSAPGVCGTNEATHELGHLLGFFHEHQRPDRETTVHFNCENVNPSCPTGTSMPPGRTCCDTTGLPTGCCSVISNFNTVSGPNIDASGLYDVQSIMQYRSNAFAKQGTLTLTPVDPNVIVPASNPSNPSAIDFDRVCKMYSGVCPKAKECRTAGCPTDCVSLPSCLDDPRCFQFSIPPVRKPACCRLDRCLPAQSRCTLQGCDFLL